MQGLQAVGGGLRHGRAATTSQGRNLIRTLMSYLFMYLIILSNDQDASRIYQDELKNRVQISLFFNLVQITSAARNWRNSVPPKKQLRLLPSLLYKSFFCARTWRRISCFSWISPKFGAGQPGRKHWGTVTKYIFNKTLYKSFEKMCSRKA